MRIRVISVGRPKDLAPAIAEFERRAARYWPLDTQEVREERGGALPAEQVRRREGERLLEVAGVGKLIACDERGTGMASDEFARWLGAEREYATDDLVFLIGGAFGLSQEVRTRAARLLSLGPWTVPHDLARLVLAEQLYRAGTILRGEPYHK